MNWKPIDTAPRDGTEILASDYDAIQIVRWKPCAFGLFPVAWVNRQEHVMYPTHWQPLPDHPPLPEEAP